MSATVDRLASALADRYRVDRELGQGGMATVYLAHDIKHDRDVAIKVLHADLGAVLGADRFLSEIRTTARLQHPHILPLLDSGDADGLLYYVMPLVTGETLRARLDRERQLPIADAITIAREVADALGYAHGLGVIHRDIKPENVLLQGGHALVADFGIALAVQSAGSARMTQTGLSLGTPQYMSPEQAMGERTIDARSDIYALGAVTYEMLVGEPPFTGPSVQAIVAKVMTERPTPLHTIRDTVPPGVEHAVLTALAKLPADRYATTVEFTNALTSAHAARTPAGPSHSARSVNWPMLAALTTAAAFAVLAAAGWLRHSPPARVIRVAMAFPPGQELRPQFFGFAFDLSRDGSRLAYVGPGSNAVATQLWIRPLDALSATPVPGTTGAYSVEWSPDGRSLLFATGGGADPQNAVVSADGGQVIHLAGVREATWGDDGAIYYFPRGGKGVLVRQRIGGRSDTVPGATIDTGYSDRPLVILPGAHAALVFSALKSVADTTPMQIHGLQFGTGTTTTIGTGVFARYLPGHGLLRTAADGSVFLDPFDPAHLRVTGPTIPVTRVALGQNSGNRNYPQISVADDGTMIYLSGAVQERIRWLDAAGAAGSPTDIAGDLWGVALSPDGTQLAFSQRFGPASNGPQSFDIWVENLKTGARTRLTTAFRNMRPSWSPDGKYVLWARIGGVELQSLQERRADASEPERLVLSRAQFRHSIGDARWLPDHRTVLVATYADEPNGRNIYAITPGRDSAARPVATMDGNQTSPMPSPDGTLVAYNSDESGTRELFIQPIVSGAGRLQVPDGGATAGRWSHDGRSLYYWNQSGQLMVASIQSKPALTVTGTHEVAGHAVLAGGVGQNGGLFDITPDGRVLAAEELPGSFQLILVRNWMAGLTPAAKP
ncbi:MAG TPA: protein kinase [Gemmatimonadales bacterium]